MSDSPTRYCPNCGAPLDPDAPDALCPKCLIENAAWSQTIVHPGDMASAPTIQDGSATPYSGPPPATPPVGADFGGYRILRALGRGGMGAVYEAEQVDSGRRVALKVLSHKLDSEEARKRFIREGRLAASINHPNSVYVFGTEEIEGTPTIAMEIVPGGTLQEKIVKDGPMPVPKAVDAILQIVGGLESAQAIGILHRDVKPSNCFVDNQGNAKIGDFGLSISTEARGDSHLTIQGSLLGTPAFSSPEQLRGDELNARSDMYSVGATLFYLLTGHAPFEEGNMVKLLSRVLEELPPNPRRQVLEIPRKLASIIMRCLAKTPADRYKSYADLVAALRPYSSESPSPATLALRFGAYILDTVVMSVVGFIVHALAWGSPLAGINPALVGTPKWIVVAVLANFITALYFGLLEGVWGASLGKRLLRLRLVRPDGSLAGFPRAFLRVWVFLVLLSGPYWIAIVASPGVVRGEAGPLLSTLVSATNLIMIAVLFSAARRRNGYAGLHGLSTGTRVVRAGITGRRPGLVLDEESTGAPRDGAQRIGPFDVIEPLGASPQGQWFLAFDRKLLRKVWVHAVAPGTAPVSPVQRNLNRAGRLRWITGRRSDDENWDAFEAPAGKPLTALLDEAQGWAAVRFWLLDLVDEFAAARSDGTVPETLAFDRVWITADGHAKLLDFPAPGAAETSSRYTEPAEFVRAVGAATATSAAPPLPLHAHTLLAADEPAKLETLYLDLNRSVRRPDHISRLRRVGISIAVSAFPAISVIFGFLFLTINRDMQVKNPELMTLSSVTLIIQQGGSEPERENLRRYIAHHLRDVVENPATWDQWEASFLVDIRRQQIAKDAVAAYPSLTPKEIAAAEAAAAPILKNKPGLIPELPPVAPLVLIFSLWIIYAVIPSLVMALIMRRGLILMMFGTVVVTRDGQRASRLRVLRRGMIAWSPFILGPFLAGALIQVLGGHVVTVIVVLVLVSLPLYSLACRGRSLQDRLAGTWLVPK